MKVTPRRQPLVSVPERLDSQLPETRRHLPAMALSPLALGVLLVTAATPPAEAAPGGRVHADKARIIEHWTPQRRDAAIPRDLVIDSRGLGYLRKADGSLEPYGHEISAEASPRKGPPGGSGDTTGPAIGDLNPADGATIGSAKTFTATVADESGIKTVNFVIQYPNNGPSQSFSASPGGGDTWSVPLSGFSDGDWQWWVQAKDNGPKGGNESTSATMAFTVDTAGGGGTGGDGDTVVNEHWGSGGAVQTAAGRIYFEMLSTTRVRGKIVKDWLGYVCSGTVVEDEVNDRSVILTAAHCVYDDVSKTFARNVMFIPDQDGTNGSGTDGNCSNDPLGCWAPDFGVVDENWTTRTFPDNIPWDYAFYAVDDVGAHTGTEAGSEALDVAAGSLPLSFVTPYVDDGTAGAASDDFTHALGYSYSDDPYFMYCAEDMTTEGSDNWWLPSCGLSGGASGGPWVQPMDEATGTGSIISVNSWGYTTSPGMAGPKLSESSASCVFDEARDNASDWSGAADGAAGVPVNCD